MDQESNQHVLVHSMESEFADESLCENYFQSDVEDTLTDQGQLESGSRSSLSDIHDECDRREKFTEDSDSTLRDTSLGVDGDPRELVRADTPSESVATESVLYETPFTSASGFDVYLTAFEESIHSIDKVLKLDNLIEIPAAASKPDQSRDVTAHQELPPKPQSKGGKGGERLGTTAKCTPKKTMPSSPQKSADTSCREPNEETPSHKPKTPNGSVNSERFGNLKAITKGIKGIKGGTRALLIQKVRGVLYSSVCISGGRGCLMTGRMSLSGHR